MSPARAAGSCGASSSSNGRAKVSLISKVLHTMPRAMIFFLCLIVSGSVFARELPTPTVFPIVVSGERTRVGITYHLNPDCTSAGRIIVRLSESPADGVAELLTEQAFPDYADDDQRFKCNEKSSELPAFYYTSRPGFKGRDRFVVEIFFSNGNYRRRAFNIEVR